MRRGADPLPSSAVSRCSHPSPLKQFGSPPSCDPVGHRKSVSVAELNFSFPPDKSPAEASGGQSVSQAADEGEILLAEWTISMIFKHKEAARSAGVTKEQGAQAA